MDAVIGGIAQLATGAFMDAAFTQIIGIASTVVLTTIGTFFTTGHTLRKSAANEAQIRQEELDRHARYLAIRVVCKLDPFISDCCDVAADSGMPDEDGVSRTRVANPVLTLPEDVDWKAISPDLMYRVLGLPTDIEVARQSVDFVGSEIASPPFYEEYYDERTTEFGRLGLAVLTLADDIRRTYGIPQREYGNWHPRDTLNKAIAKTEKRQRAQRAESSDMIGSISNDIAAKQD